MPANGLETLIGSSADENDESDQAALADNVETLVAPYISLIASMRAVRPDVVRGIRLHRILQGMPWLWARGKLDSLHSFSEVTITIDEFWSHSWQSAAWTKFPNALMLNHGSFAFAASILIACLACALVLVDVVPPLHVGSLGPKQCLLSGSAAYYTSLALSRRNKLIFLDIACINQVDQTAKAEGIVSLGAVLKHSMSMLVFWDPTFVRRLWCMFELSAFLHSRRAGTKPSLTICTPFLGAVLLGCPFAFCIIAFLYSGGFGNLFKGINSLFLLALCIFCLTPLSYAVRRYWRTIDAMEQQACEFSLDGSLSACCQHDHPQGLCDRSILLPCIVSWFGSVSNFEKVVQTEVRVTLAHQLRNNTTRYFYFVSATVPVLWRGLDGVADAPQGKKLAELCRQLAAWLAVLPCVIFLMLRLMHRLRAWAGNMFCDLLLSAGIVFVSIAVFLLCHMAEIFLFDNYLGSLLGPAAYLAATSTVAICAWCCSPELRPISASPTDMGSSESEGG